MFSTMYIVYVCIENQPIHIGPSHFILAHVQNYIYINTIIILLIMTVLFSNVMEILVLLAQFVPSSPHFFLHRLHFLLVCPPCTLPTLQKMGWVRL